MGLFRFFKKKPESFIVELVSTKKEKAEIEKLKVTHAPLEVSIDLTDNGNLLFRVGPRKWCYVGKFPPKITDAILEKYSCKNGISCNLIIGDDYKIEGEKIIARVTAVPET